MNRIAIQDDISSTWRIHYGKVPPQVVFLGQRLSNYVKLKIDNDEPVTVCEVEAIGNIYSFKFW